jgi:hypothetical protein
MLTLGFAAGISGSVVLGQNFTDLNGRTCTSTYIIVANSGAEGSLVYVNSNGQTQYAPYVFFGYNPIAATKVLSSAIIDGTIYSTTATGLSFAGSSAY